MKTTTKNHKAKGDCSLAPCSPLDEAMELITIMRDAFYCYEMDVEEPAPYVHRDMMARVENFLKANK